MQRIDLTYEWNDVALLTDQRAYTFICKTMLQIPEDEVKTLQEMILVDWGSRSAQKDSIEFDGYMQLQAGYLNGQGQHGELQMEVPLSGKLQEPLTERTKARLLYSRGKIAGSCLLLETVLQLSRELSLQRSQVIAGTFVMNELLELPAAWPGCREVLATAASLQVQDCQIAGAQLLVQGQYEMAVVYASEEQPGECLFAYEQKRPVTLAVAVPAGLQEIEPLQPCYQDLSVQLLDDHRIQISGSGVLCTVAVPEEEGASAQCRQEEKASEAVADDQLTRQVTEALHQLMQELQRHTDLLRPEQQEQATERPLGQTAATTKEKTEPQPEPPLIKQNETVCETVCPIERGKPGKNSHPSVVNCRGSRRANLSKYMRNLNSSVQSPNAMRNFEIGGEQEGEPSEETETQE